MTDQVDSSLSIDDKLERLASKAKDWRLLGREKKLEYILYAVDALSKSVSLFEEVCTTYATELRKVPPEEMDYFVAEDMLVHAVGTGGILNMYAESYKVLIGKSTIRDTLTNLETRKIGENGPVVAKVFPLLESEKTGMYKDAIGEVYFAQDKVTTVDQVKPFQLEELEDEEPGVCVVLGAGNYPSLSILDTVYQLFQKGNVVFVKQHFMRAGVEKVMRRLFKPLYDDGYMDSEEHIDMDRSSAMVYSPHVSQIHMTGGKASHDTIVWGSTIEEQERRKAKKDPKLKAKMTSELGAITPYIIVQSEYTQEELDYQARVLAAAKWINGGASCNAPQVVVMSSQWEQREEFVSLVENCFTDAYCPVAYYPGSQARVDRFREHYEVAEASTISSWMGKLPASGKSNHIPLTAIHFEVDLSTQEGKEAAKQQYALRTEVFGPVLIFCTVKAHGTPENYMEQVVELCNDCIYGTLSCSIMVQDHVAEEPYMERAYQDLQYGTIALNFWTGAAFSMSFGIWGGAPNETVEDAQTGVGHVNNVLFLTNADKFVARKPCLSETPIPLDITAPRPALTATSKAFAKYIIQPSLLHFVGVLAVLVGPAIYLVPAGFLGLVAVGISYYIRSTKRPPG
eukprot:CAMPEP_0172446166 /NCGR_PEP_ID=MMETSP1065-20121228/5830_1 /TAXON_ID=265537 /ORGANISM="Amphiprora paludosa, Strain CCMP125" /LENGTH=625 /DNA_ID=CAMNT_0013197221 /DNA_START=93 /DNA_END=1970 /DNA_ORIENTATION=-